VVASVDGLRLGLHVCRGNWSPDEKTLLSGGSGRISTGCKSHSSSWNTPPSGPALVRFEGKELGLGVVNPRTDQVETPEQIRAAVKEALRLYPAERLFLNPDCGFGTFSNRPMNTLEIASAKVAAMAAAARDLRGRS
jgi:5-methyltetrahydropteroyltriglutamate--homocysteine methyltransferase